MSLSPASGIGKYYRHSAKIIRFARHGCTNRPFFHIVVMEVRSLAECVTNYVYKIQIEL